MNKQCEIIQDLLPLYVDGACSEASAEMIREHLETCEACKDMYEKLCSHTNEDILQKEADGVIIRHEKKESLKIIKNFFLAFIIIFIPALACIALGSSISNDNYPLLTEFAFLGGWVLLISFPYYLSFIELVFTVFRFLEKRRIKVIDLIFDIIGLLLVLSIIIVMKQITLQYILSIILIFKWLISAIVCKRKSNLKATLKQKGFWVWMIILSILVLIASVVPIATTVINESKDGYIYSFGISKSGSEYEGVYFSINENSSIGWDLIADDPSIILKLVNSTDNEIKYNLNCYIYKKTDSGWELCANKPIDFSENNYTLYPSKNAIHDYSIKGYEFKESGKYKFVTIIEEKEVWIEFSIRLGNPNGRLGRYLAKYTLDESVIVVDNLRDFEERKDEIIAEYSKGNKIIVAYDAPTAYAVHATFIDSDETIFYADNFDVILFFNENGETRTSEMHVGQAYLDESIDNSVSSIKRSFRNN